MGHETIDITKLDDLRVAAKDIVVTLPSVSSASVLALHGDLGAGKTTFVQAIAGALGVEETVVSPTFVIMKKYETADGRFKNIIHIDAYRIEESKELDVLGFSEELARPSSLICIEWPERIAERLPIETMHLYFDLGKAGARTLVKK